MDLQHAQGIATDGASLYWLAGDSFPDFSIYKSSNDGSNVTEMIGSPHVSCPFYLEAIPIAEDTTVAPVDYTVFRGLQVSGQLSDVQATDDQYLKFNPGITLNPSEPPVWIEFEGTLPSDNPTTLSVTLEASANSVSINQSIEMFNWDIGQYQLVDSRLASLNSDSVVTINVTSNVADYVQAGTGHIKTRTGWRASGIVFLFPWTICIDHVAWTVESG
jgi:hypothetical protein